MFSKLLKYLPILSVLALGLMTQLARADENKSLPVPPTLANIAQALLRVGEITLDKDETVDEFARIAYCDIYQHYYSDEFQWRRVRAALRKSVQLHLNSYPVQFRLERVENMSRYDFNTNKLSLADDSVMRKTVYLQLLKLNNDEIVCGKDLVVFPKLFVAVLDKPLQLEGVPMAENDAHSLVENLKRTDKGREAYARFIISLRPQVKIISDKDGRRANIYAHLDQITFYQDVNYIKPFFTESGEETTPLAMLPSLDQIPFKGITEFNPPQDAQPLPISPN